MSEGKVPTTNAEQMLNDLDGGVFIAKLGRALSDVALGSVSTLRKGKVTIEFDIKPITEHQVQIDHKVKFTKPTQRGRVIEENTTATPMHVGVGGRLTLFPETQQSLFEAGEKSRTQRSDA